MRHKLITALSLAMLCIPAYADTTPATTEQPAVTAEADPAQSVAEKNRVAGAAFLKANKSKPGVITLPDGLQYKIIEAGKGEKPTDNDIVVVDYAGHLLDGSEFDNSAKHGGPSEFPVGQVIPGWTEILKMMPVGSTWEIYVPSDLAYAEQGAPPLIDPNQTLIFKITLHSIKKNS